MAARDAHREAPAAAAEPVVATASALKVLVVDDHADAAQLLAISLRAIGFITDIALDGPRAIEQARTFSPDVVLLDLGLPVMDGFEVALRLKSDPDLRHAKLVAVTGYGQAGDRERTREMGFDEHFVKPVDFDHLESWLRAVRYDPTADAS